MALPAYALITTPTEVAEVRVGAQALSVGADPTPSDLIRDDYLVTRTDLGNYAAFARVDDAFHQ